MTEELERREGRVQNKIENCMRDEVFVFEYILKVLNQIKKYK